MRFADAAGFALSSLRKRRLRTLLTAAGVMIGIGALVSMISFGKGIQKNVTEAFKTGDLFNTIMVLPGGPSRPSGDPDAGRKIDHPAARTDAVLDADAVAAIAGLPGVLGAYPDVNFPALVDLDGEQEFRLVQVVPAEALRSKAFGIRWGRTFASDDEAGAIVSSSLARRLGTRDPASAVGKTVRLTSVSLDFGRLLSSALGGLLAGGGLPLSRETYEFPIVGVSETKPFGPEGSLMGNDLMLPPGPAGRIKKLPIASVWDLFRMRDGRVGYSAVNVRLRAPGDLESVRSRVHEMGFATFALADQFDQIVRGFYFLDAALAAVGMIAIVVAALGIVNTMVMSILERTREIGVMKAVGAGDGDIRRIFFFESGAIGLLGGASGCLLGWVTSLVINRVINAFAARQGMPFVNYFAFPAWLFLGAVGFAVLVSLAAGLYPARRAARVDPVVALRHD
jgi:putative ABC transport system permease protein